jgi:hypothetical protein
MGFVHGFSAAAYLTKRLDLVTNGRKAPIILALDRPLPELCCRTGPAEGPIQGWGEPMMKRRKPAEKGVGARYQPSYG